MRVIADAAAVEQGAALLDKRLPGWRNEIDPDKLALQQQCGCVLGQLFGDYDRGLRVLGLTHAQGRTLGFYRERSAWSALTNAWRRLVAA